MGVRLVPLAMAVVVAPALLCAQAPTSPQTAFHFRCGAGTGLQVQLGPDVTWSHQRGYGFRTLLAGSSRNACSSDKPFIFDVALPEGDLNAMSRQFYEAMGPEKSVKAFVHYPAGTYPDQKVELTDDTHFNNYGAYEMARMIVRGLKDSGLPLARELMDGIPRFDPLHPDSIEAFRLPASPVPENHHYVFSYFQGNGEDGLHLAYSTDGLTWRALKHDSAFFKPTVGVEKLTRDPSIVRGPDGTYHMVWTAGWNEHGFGYAESKDLVAWTNETYVPAMAYEPTALNTWAPELFYDSSNGRHLIYLGDDDSRSLSGYGRRGRRWEVQPPSLLCEHHRLPDLHARKAPVRARLQCHRRRHHSRRHALRDVPEGRDGAPAAEEHPSELRGSRGRSVVGAKCANHGRLLGGRPDGAACRRSVDRVLRSISRAQVWCARFNRPRDVDGCERGARAAEWHQAWYGVRDSIGRRCATAGACGPMSAA